jgi:transcription termination factor Rho
MSSNNDDLMKYLTKSSTKQTVEPENEPKVEPVASEAAPSQSAQSTQQSAPRYHKFSYNKHVRNNNGNPNLAGRGEEEVSEVSREPKKLLNTLDLRHKTVDELLEMAQSYNIENTGGLLKRDLIFLILRAISETEEYDIISDGVLEIMIDGYGFLRSQDENYAPSQDDVYVPNQQIKKYNLRTGDHLKCFVRGPRLKEKYFSLRQVIEINDVKPDERHRVKNFDNMTPCYPKEQFMLEVENAKDFSNRIISLVAPIGKGQRALIVAPPRSGKTILLQNIARAITTNHPEVYLIVLLIDERPEEVTDMKLTIKGEIVSSTFDEPVTRHVSLAEIVIEKAKRLVEDGRDVVIMLDNITRLARAYNAVTPSSGKVLSGGVDSNALQLPKRFFGAARNIQNGGSLTIIATALIETGSRMDEVIFEEFKGTGNCEIILDRKLADKRIYPAIDMIRSGTRKEEEMLTPTVLTKTWLLRRVISGMSSIEAAEFVTKKIKETKNNNDFFNSMNS